MQPQIYTKAQHSKLAPTPPTYTISIKGKFPYPHQHVAFVNSVDRKLIKKNPPQHLNTKVKKSEPPPLLSPYTRVYGKRGTYDIITLISKPMPSYNQKHKTHNLWKINDTLIIPSILNSKHTHTKDSKHTLNKNPLINKKLVPTLTTKTHKQKHIYLRIYKRKIKILMTHKGIKQTATLTNTTLNKTIYNLETYKPIHSPLQNPNPYLNYNKTNINQSTTQYKLSPKETIKTRTPLIKPKTKWIQNKNTKRLPKTNNTIKINTKPNIPKTNKIKNLLIHKEILSKPSTKISKLVHTYLQKNIIYKIIEILDITTTKTQVPYASHNQMKLHLHINKLISPPLKSTPLNIHTKKLRKKKVITTTLNTK